MRPSFGVIVGVLVLLSLVQTDQAFAQLEENLGGMTETNAEKYLAPLDTGLSGTLNSAIFRTGYVPASGLTFTMGVTAIAVGFSDHDRTYVPTDPVGFISEQETEVPTVIGSLEGASVAGQSGLVHTYPGGFDIESFEMAVPQLSIGSVMGTRAIVRYVALDLGDTEIGDFSYLGLGAQHSISQWFDNLPVDLAAGFFFHQMDLGDDLLKTRAYQINLTASREYGILQPYLGIGYDSIQSELDYVDEEDEDFSLALTLERQNDVHFTLGTLVRFSVLAVFAEFNAAAGSGFALGIELGK